MVVINACKISRWPTNGCESFGNQNNSSAILITGRRFRNWFPFDSWNVGLSLVVSQVKDHVPKLAFVQKLTALWTLKEVFFFFVA